MTFKLKTFPSCGRVYSSFLLLGMCVAGLPQALLAQTATLVGASGGDVSCQYSSLALNATNGAITIQCTGTPPPPSGGLIEFSVSQSAVSDNVASTSISVQRSGNSPASLATVAYQCATTTPGYAPVYSPAASGTLEFSGNVTKTITVSALALPAGTQSATVTCTLGPTVSGAEVGQRNQHTLTVTAASAAGCTTRPVAKFGVFSGGRAQISAFKSGEVGTVEIEPGKSGFNLNSYFASNGTSATGYQVVLSKCAGGAWGEIPPGNSASPGNCQRQYGRSSLLYAKTTAPFASNECKIEPGVKYYVNVRYVDSTGKATCTSTAGCGPFNVDLNTY